MAFRKPPLLLTVLFITSAFFTFTLQKVLFHGPVAAQDGEDEDPALQITLPVEGDCSLAGAADRTRYDFTSVLRTIENRFALPPLSTRDRDANDLSGGLDLAQRPLAPVLIGEPPAP